MNLNWNPFNIVAYGQKKLWGKCREFNNATAHCNKILQKIYVVENSVGFIVIFFFFERKIISKVIAIFRTSVFAGRLWDYVESAHF